jgi:hypothetical protein
MNSESAAGWSPARIEILDRLSDASRPANEDAIGATGVAAWVIDGTKGPFDRRLTPGASDAAWHAATLDAVLTAAFADRPMDPSRTLADAAEALGRAYTASAHSAPAHEQPSACLALVALATEGMLHLFNIGDCRILVQSGASIRSFGSSEIEGLEKAAIAEITRLRSGVASGASDPRMALRETLRRNFETAMNQPGGYWVVHPTLPWLHEVQMASLSPHEADHILIASDGFFRLVNVFRLYDERSLVAAARAKGLTALCAELRVREGEDPSCLRFPRLKAMDDASAMLIAIRT